MKSQAPITNANTVQTQWSDYDRANCANTTHSLRTTSSRRAGSTGMELGIWLGGSIWDKACIPGWETAITFSTNIIFFAALAALAWDPESGSEG